MGDIHPTPDASMMQRLAERKAQVRAESNARLAAIEAAMTPQWKALMHTKMADLQHKAASPRSKLPKLYLLMEEVGGIRAPHLACNAGCSACCQDIPVEISDLEAKHISAATGRAHVNLPPGRHTLPGKATERASTPCPFLVDARCSIYEFRPYNCRSLGVVDQDALTCCTDNTRLTRANDPRAVPVPMTKMQAFDPLYRELSQRPNTVWADIRQFFPPQAKGGA